MNLARESLDLRQGFRGRISPAREHHHVGLADSLARPCRSFATAEVNHQRCGVFELVEPVGDLGCVQRAPGKHGIDAGGIDNLGRTLEDRKSTRLNSSHQIISYAVFCLKKKKKKQKSTTHAII